ncbi:MAG: phosphoenolpyruvate carboxykinase domain-containing protein, partial [bacterium]
SDKLPKVFNVNWFRQDAEGHYIWPGFGENLRVLRWVLDRCAGRGEAVRTPIGYLPTPGAIDTEGLEIGADAMRDLTSIDPVAWIEEIEDIESFFAKFGERIPRLLIEQAGRIKSELHGA